MDHLRLVLRRIGFLRSTWYLAHELTRLFSDAPRSIRAIVDADYMCVDPWHYTTNQLEQDRFRDQCALLDQARAGELFGNALEVGCSEGVFTEQLAPRCASLLAVDLSPVALARARQRCHRCRNVRFAKWDLLGNRVHGQFDLVVVTGVLEYLTRPSNFRAVREKLVGGVRPGSYLLVETTARSEVVENSWWGKYLIRGKWINAFVSKHKALQVVGSISTLDYEITLLQKNTADDVSTPLAHGS
jgi:cyclopropane fatty-acyl-phospholipid synthase-like methyltransferase